MSEKLLTLNDLKTQLYYNPETGIFTRLIRKSNNTNKGENAGVLDTARGYLLITINNKKYYAHRLAWFYTTGEMPINEIDHINRNKSDNRLINLRDATHLNNSRNVSKKKNNTSGITGVSWDKRRNHWVAYINPNRKKIHLGSFKDKELAELIVTQARTKYFGEYAGGL